LAGELHSEDEAQSPVSESQTDNDDVQQRQQNHQQQQQQGEASHSDSEPGHVAQHVKRKHSLLYNDAASNANTNTHDEGQSSPLKKRRRLSAEDRDAVECLLQVLSPSKLVTTTTSTASDAAAPAEATVAATTSSSQDVEMHDANTADSASAPQPNVKPSNKRSTTPNKRKTSK
jgi:hypothetical protein